MSARSAYRLRLVSVLGSLLGAAAAPPGEAKAAIDRTEIGAILVSEKLADIREATTIVLEGLRQGDPGKGLATIDDLLMAQWFNWGNWRNWANWLNWANWGSWLNG
jgi:hypothetical protein